MGNNSDQPKRFNQKGNTMTPLGVYKTMAKMTPIWDQIIQLKGSNETKGVNSC